MLRFENSFKIYQTRTDQILLKTALRIAREHNVSQFVYDPLGMFSAASWWWCAAVLEVLQQEDIIREFEVIAGAPADQSIETKLEKNHVF